MVTNKHNKTPLTFDQKICLTRNYALILLRNETKANHFVTWRELFKTLKMDVSKNVNCDARVYKHTQLLHVTTAI